MSMHILVVDDDRAVRESLARSLQYSGYEVDSAADGVEALAHLSGSHPDAVIMDVMMPRLDGLEATRMLRSNGNDVPILVLTARDAVDDRVDGLDAGADDYMVKPFALDELLARLRVALRRARQDSGHAGAPEAVFTNGELTIDYAAGCTYLAGQEVHLTPIEYKLLCLLAKNVGKVLTHNFILKEVWGSALPGDTPSLRVFMATLRKKIEPVPAQPKYIQTHVGVGYRMLRIAEGEPVQKNG